MLVSYRWICEITPISDTPDGLAERLTFSGLEIEGVHPVGVGLDNIVVGKIKTKDIHPENEKLTIVSVETGDGPRTIVCGAPNCPEPGSHVVAALPGAMLGDLSVEPRKLKGVLSEGVLLSELELGVGQNHDGVMILDGISDSPPGTPIADALDLKDWILDISITPNRPDALSHFGIAREAAVLYGIPFEPPSVSPPETSSFSTNDFINIEIEDTIGCPRYRAAILRGVNPKPSPFPTRYRLHKLGIRPIFNLVDITNLILLEYGQPLHAFDLDKLEGQKIEVRRARESENITTLDTVERILQNTDLLICDKNRPIAIAGIMGGLNTEVTEKSKNILIECAYFEPSSIRRTSKRLKLQSEASFRFERGVDPNMSNSIIHSTLKRMQSLAGGEIAADFIDCYSKPIPQKEIKLRPSRYHAIMGKEVSKSSMKTIIKGLGGNIEEIEEALTVSVPTFRPDIEREIDLIEEIARIRGYGEIPVKLPRIRCISPQRPIFESTRRAKEIFFSLGLSEAITYSFVPEEMLVSLHRDKDAVKISNPLNAERSTMRTTLIVGLLENLKRAHSRFLPNLAQFEIGSTFHETNNELPLEVNRCAVILSGQTNHWIGEKARVFDFYDTKGITENFILEYCGKVPTFQRKKLFPFLHPRKSCEIFIDEDSIGFMGEIHPDFLKTYKLPSRTCVMEANLEILWSNKQRPKASDLPEFPAIVRDVALLVKEEQDSGPVRTAIERECGNLAEKVILFDVYQGDATMSAGMKSLAFSITYRSPDRTLTEEEIDNLHVAAIKRVLSKFDAIQR